MLKNYDSQQAVGFTLDDNPDLSLGLKELVFLAFIFFFGFSGFSICVDKIYSTETTQVSDQIDKVILHEEDVSLIELHLGQGYNFQ